MNTRMLFVVLALMFAVQTAHHVEHVTQLIQIYGLGVKPPEAHGLLGSVLDFEWVHFGYNIGLEIALVMLWWMYRSAGPWKAASVRPVGFHALAVLIVFQGYHSIEHIIKLTQYLFVPLYQSGKVPTPGLLPQVTGWPIFLVHFGFNMIVWTLMLLALWSLRPHRRYPVGYRLADNP